MITNRTLPGYIWFDGHTKFRSQFKKKFYWEPDYREFLVCNNRREKKVLRAEVKLKMERKINRIRQAYEPQK